MGMPFFTEGREQDEDWLPKNNSKWSEYGTVCMSADESCIEDGGEGCWRGNVTVYVLEYTVNNEHKHKDDLSSETCD